MTSITQADLDAVFVLLVHLDAAVGHLVAQTPDPSLARAAAVSLHCDVGNLHARTRTFRTQHAGGDTGKPAPEPPAAEETVSERVWRQAVAGRLDEDRLLPGREKRARDLTKKLDRGLEGLGWTQFVAGAAFTMETGKAPQRKNAEVALVKEVTRWRKDVLELLPERERDLAAIVLQGLANPAPPPGKPS